MTPTDEKLKIALEALLELKNLSSDDLDDYYDYSTQIVAEALLAIQREHYLGSPSPVVHEVLAGVKGL